VSMQAELLGPDTLADLTDTTAANDAQAAQSTQWKLDALQVINWGGFHGYHRLPFHPEATLLSGGSGTGKSTLLDAYTALMMPFSVAFNGASNDSGTGRARNEAGGQRTLLTYLRGKQGVNDETGGATSEDLLRGKGQATWGAIAGVFVNVNGDTFTAFRVFFVPASATDVASISQRMATYPGTVDLRDLAEPMRHHTAGKPLANLMTATWPGVKVFAKYSEFSNTIFTKLAIGGLGGNLDGRKALELLARIQAGRPVNSVNVLYRDLVLDTPATFKAADLALEHFDTIAEDLARMVEAERKHQMLRNIRDVHANLEEARTRLAALDQYGLTEPGFTKLTAWTLRKEEDLLDVAADLAHERQRTATSQRDEAHKAAEHLHGELESAREDYRTSGGDTLTNLGNQIDTLHGDLVITERNRAELMRHVETVDRALEDRSDFDELIEDATRFARGREEWTHQFEARRDALRDRQQPLTAQRNELRADLDHLNKSGTRIKPDMAQLRDLVARRLNMAPAELPFIAELIDLRPEHERWRTAIETVLGGDASRIIVPQHRHREAARLLNDLQVSRQVRLIDGIPDQPPRYPLTGAETRDQDGRILGKLAFADSSYAGWLQAHLDSPGLNALCVDNPDDLDGPGLRVSATGQMRSGIRSSIGRNSTRNIIGFSNAEEIERLEDELAVVERELDELIKGLSALEGDRRTFEKRRDAYGVIAQTRWSDVDVDGLRARIADLEEQRDKITGSDDKLRSLGGRIEDLKAAHSDALVAHAKLVDRAETAEEQWSGLIEAKDHVGTKLDPHRYNDAYDLTDDQEADLASVYAATVAHAADEDAIVEAKRFGERLAAMLKTLEGQAKAARADVEAGQKNLADTFSLYRGTWFDANLGETHEAYPDYLHILEGLEKEGMHKMREEWQRTVALWSGQDLMPLSQLLSSEVDAIKERVAPINDILSTLPFGARRGRLKLKVDDVSSESVRQFRAKLRKMTTLATAQMTFEATRKAFDEFATFMDHMRDPKDPKYNPDRSDRAKLLDVRRHVEVYAVEYPVYADTWAAREHRQLGSASGGESQELIAFIIGSALRFRLGDELRDRPRFAPVFLDEGFVKADSEFAGRAVKAWRKLGFQIIVGTPEDKFTGLERHMKSFVVVYKDATTGYSYLDHVTEHPDQAQLTPAAYDRQDASANAHP
jgi:uncharacterized protein YPO0396